MSRPSIEVFHPRNLGKRSWGSETLIAETDQYLGKLLKMHKGHAGGLQYHRVKVESFHLFYGKARVDYDKDGKLVSLMMTPGMTVHVPAGAPHRVLALEDSMFFEVSTPVFDDRVRVETEYGEPDTGGLPTTGS